MSWFKKIVTVEVLPSDDAVMIASSMIYDPQDWKYSTCGLDGKSHFFHNEKLDLNLHWYEGSCIQGVSSYTTPKTEFSDSDFRFLKQYMQRLLPKPAKYEGPILRHLRNMRGQ